MYFAFVFIYIYVFYIKLFAAGIGMLRSKTTFESGAITTQRHPFDNTNTPAGDITIQHDVLKGKKCNNQIVRLEQKSINCESLCGGSYTKKTLTDVNLYPGLDAGVYCVPRVLDTCHPYTGTIAKDSHGWSCVSKYPFVFGGPDADEIVSCDGDLVDAINPENPVVYRNRIPRYLKIFTNPEHDRNSIGEWRFTCPKRIDFMNNDYVSTDVSRLHTVRNVCAQMLVHDNGRSIPNFEYGVCKCPEGDYSEYSDDRVGLYCAPTARSLTEKGIGYFYEPCLKPNQPINESLKPCPLAIYQDDNAASLTLTEIGISTGGLSSRAYNDLNKPL